MSEGINGEINGETSEETSEAIQPMWAPSAYIILPEEDLSGLWWSADYDELYYLEVFVLERYLDLGVFSWRLLPKKDEKPDHQDFMSKSLEISQKLHDARHANPPKHKFGSEDSFVELLTYFHINNGKTVTELREEARKHTEFRLNRGPISKTLHTSPQKAKIPNAQPFQLMNKLVTRGNRASRYSETPWITFDIETMQLIWADPKHRGEGVKLVRSMEKEITEAYKGQKLTNEEIERAMLQQFYDELFELGLDETLTATYGFIQLVNSNSNEVDLTVKELLVFNGKDNLYGEARRKQIEKYERTFQLWVKYTVICRDYYTDRTTNKRAPRVYKESFIKRVRPFWDNSSQLSFPFSGVAPDGFTLEVTEVTKMFRQYPEMLKLFGDLLPLAELPSGQASNVWAKHIGMTVVQLIRNNISNNSNQGITRALTRRVLLYNYPCPERYDAEKILKSKNPQKALDYWGKAINRLKEAGLIATVKEPPFPKTKDGKKKTQGWQDDWLDQAVTITLTEPYGKPLKAIYGSSLKRKQKRTKENSPKALPQKP